MVSALRGSIPSRLAILVVGDFEMARCAASFAVRAATQTARGVCLQIAEHGVSALRCSIPSRPGLCDPWAEPFGKMCKRSGRSGFRL